MNTPTKFEIKIGAGREMLTYWFYIFPSCAVLLVAYAFLFKPMFGISAGSSKVFMNVLLYGTVSCLALGPILFLCGFVSKRMQRKYLTNKIAGLECIIKNNKDSIQSFKKSMDHHAQEQLGRIKLEIEERKLYNEKLKEELIDSMRSSTKELKSFSQEKLDSMDDEDLISKLELESAANNFLLNADDVLLDDISELNNNFKSVEEDYKKFSEQTINHYNKSSEEWEQKMRLKIKESKDAIMSYSTWLEAI